MSVRKYDTAVTMTYPARYLRYSFIPGHNDTLEITENNKPVSIDDVPEEAKATMDISMGHAGMRYCTLPWWKTWRLDFAAWWYRKVSRIAVALVGP